MKDLIFSMRLAGFTISIKHKNVKQVRINISFSVILQYTMLVKSVFLSVVYYSRIPGAKMYFTRLKIYEVQELSGIFYSIISGPNSGLNNTIFHLLRRFVYNI